MKIDVISAVPDVITVVKVWACSDSAVPVVNFVVLCDKASLVAMEFETDEAPDWPWEVAVPLWSLED